MATTDLARARIGDTYPIGTRIGESGSLEVGGCDLAELAEQFGTPAYIYAEDDLRTRARTLRDAVDRLAPGGEVGFSIKPLPCRAVLRLFSSEGLRISVASEGELRLALTAGVEPAQITLHGPASTPGLLDLACEVGVGRLVVDGLDVAELAERAAAAHGRSWDVLLRVVADVPAAANTRADPDTGQIDLKAGVPIHRGEAAAAVARLRDSSHLRLCGLHQHYSEMLIDARFAALGRLADLVAETGMACEVISAGGGPAVEPQLGGPGPDIAGHVAETARRLDSEMRRVGLPMPRLGFEPGASLVGRGGVILYRVVGVRRGVRSYAVLDGGITTDACPLLLGRQRSAAIVDRPLESGGRVSLAGCSSELGDVPVWDVELPDPQPGDLVMIPAAGPYAFALSSRFEMAPRAPVVLCRDGRARLVVRRESWDDLFAGDLGG
ncbi:MAG TPA: diaminopimelate decarboxylase [Solirubrobacteraceae bacterium]